MIFCKNKTYVPWDEFIWKTKDASIIRNVYININEVPRPELRTKVVRKKKHVQPTGFGV